MIRATGFAVQALGFVALIFGRSAVLIGHETSLPVQISGTILIAVFLFCVVHGARLSTLARYLRTRRGLRALEDPDSPPVSLMRSFGDDGYFASHWRIIGSRLSYEEALSRKLDGLGAIVTFSDSAYLGASAIVSPEDWFRAVKSLISGSKLVLFRVGTSEGFWREVCYSTRHVDPRRLLFLFPAELGRKRKEYYSRFRERMSMLKRCVLPERLDGEYLQFDAEPSGRWRGTFLSAGDVKGLAAVLERRTSSASPILRIPCCELKTLRKQPDPVVPSTALSALVAAAPWRPFAWSVAIGVPLGGAIWLLHRLVFG